MDDRSLPVLGGVGGAAALVALFLGPWFAQSTNEAKTVAPPSVQTTSPPTGPNVAPSSLNDGELGPWYAFCKAFADHDPEDSEDNPSHPFRNEAGLDIHPPLSSDEEDANEGLQEETKNLPGGIQRKFVPRHHYKADFPSCLPEQTSNITTSYKYPLNFMLATVPDPLGSHMALEFDREIVGIERAASQADLVFEGYWFPWTGIIKTEQANHFDPASDTLRQQLRQQPGLLIFRKRGKPSDLKDDAYVPRLLVFLVGETPTGGINKIAFSKAVTYTSQLACHTIGGSDNPIRSAARPELCALSSLPILGPNYSGSFSSLYSAIRDAHHLTLLRDNAAHVISANTTVNDIQDDFDKYIRTLGSLTRLSRSDQETQQQLIDQLNILGYKNSEIATLSEDETSYHPTENTQVAPVGKNGKLPHPSKYGDPIDSLTYPRDLSSVRNTWAPASVGITPADVAGESTNLHFVPFSLHEQASNELDSPSAFAREQAAPDTDQALSNLITTIHHRRYRVLIVTASNPLDQIYLLQYIHHNATDLRLVTYGQDSMMLRATNYERLRGSISVTSFPLINEWGLFGNNLDQFPDSTTQGIAIGVALILNAWPSKFPMSTIFVPDSARVDPITRDKLIAFLKGPAGIYALGTDSFWALRDQHQLAPSPLSYKQPLVPRTWYILIAILALLLTVHIRKYIHIYLPKQGAGSIVSGQAEAESKSTMAIGAHSAYFRLKTIIRNNMKGSARQEDMAEDFFLYVCTTQLGTMFMLVTLPSFLGIAAFLGFDRTAQAQDRLTRIGQYLITILKVAAAGSLIISSIFLIAVSIFLYVRLSRSIGIAHAQDKSHRRKYVASIYVIISSLYPLATVLLWCRLLIQPHSHGNVIFRTMYLLDGLSPLPVIGAVTAVWYLFGAVGMEIVRLIKLMRVNPIMLDEVPGSPSWVGDLKSARSRMFSELEGPSLSKQKGLLIFGAGYIVLGLLQAWSALRGIDEWWFRSWLFFAGVGPVGVLVLVEFGRVWSVWKRMEALFMALDYSPVGDVFDAIPKDLTTVKVWQSPETRQPPALQKHTLSRLVELSRSAPDEVQNCIQPNIDEAVRLIKGRLTKSALGDSSSFSQHRDLNDCFDLSASSCGSARQWFLEECRNRSSAALEYIALRYVAMIRYVNAQLRYLLVFVLFTYVLLIVGLETYPFEGQRSLSSVLTIIFMIVFVMAAIIIVQMDRNDFLMRLEHMPSGKTDYWSTGKRLLGVGGIPLIAVLASQFPVVERFLLSWVKPTIDNLH